MTPLRSATFAGASLDRHCRACFVARGRDEEVALLAPFFIDGTSAGDRTVYVLDADLEDDRLRQLEWRSVDVRRSVASGQLDVLAWCEGDDVLDAARLEATLADRFQRAWADGFPRSRVVVSMGWVARRHGDAEAVLEFEARLEALAAKYRQPTVCVYDAECLDAATLGSVLRSHPLLVVEGGLSENPFHVGAGAALDALRAVKATDEPRFDLWHAELDARDSVPPPSQRV